MFVGNSVPVEVGRYRVKISAPDQQTGLMYSVVFLRSSKQMSGYDFKLGHYRFLINLSNWLLTNFLPVDDVCVHSTTDSTVK
jgi:hypothetical protein